MAHADVAIIGLGPTGASLANLLGAFGLEVIVIEREASAYDLPRAVHYDDECMRIFQKIGIADQLSRQTIFADGMRFINNDGALLAEWMRPRTMGDQGWFGNYRFHQPDLERELRSALGRFAKVNVRLQTEACGLVERDDDVVIRCRRAGGAGLEEIAASFVVGCDGARSMVRGVLGATIDDLKSHARWLVVDLVLTRDRDDLGDHSIQYCDPTGPATYVRGVGRRRRWEIMLPSDHEPDPACPRYVWGMLSRWITPVDAEIERAAVYTFHSVVARGWRRGRLMIAGDAAHQTPPFLGQGMCAGIRDAANLAWKLAAVCRRGADASLLDTYETERSPNVRKFIELAVRMGEIIQMQDPSGALDRDRTLSSQPLRISSLKPVLGPGIHLQDRLGGKLSRQWRDASLGLSDTQAGDWFNLFCKVAFANALSEETKGMMEREAVRMVPIDNDDGVSWIDECEAAAVLVRPDFHIFSAIGDEAELRSAIVALRAHQGRSL
jgi:3-(3-hydroxy-phenyl)propionate hydroxylase